MLYSALYRCQVFSPRCFPKGVFPRAIPLMIISQMCNFPSGNFPKVRLGPLRRRALQWEPSAAARMGQGTERCGQKGLGDRALQLVQARGRVLRLGLTWEVAAWELAQLGSCHLGRYTWEVAAWENAFGKSPLGKCLWEST